MVVHISQFVSTSYCHYLTFILLSGFSSLFKLFAKYFVSVCVIIIHFLRVMHFRCHNWLLFCWLAFFLSLCGGYSRAKLSNPRPVLDLRGPLILTFMCALALLSRPRVVWRLQSGPRGMRAFNRSRHNRRWARLQEKDRNRQTEVLDTVHE